jgi:hypothetical protein
MVPAKNRINSRDNAIELAALTDSCAKFTERLPILHIAGGNRSLFCHPSGV